MINETIKKLREKENWDAVDMGQAVGIVMGRALNNSKQGNMAKMNANALLRSKSYKELSEKFCENFVAYYSKHLDHDKDADVNVLCSRIVLFLEDKIKNVADEEIENEVVQAIIAGYNM